MSFRTDTIIQSCRKERKCEWCRQPIRVGDQAAKIAGASDNGFWVGYFHPECYRAEKDWWHYADWPESWPEERMTRGVLDGHVYSILPLQKDQNGHILI